MAAQPPRSFALPPSSECPICRLPFADDYHARLNACPFCLRIFSRVDTAKRHAKDCPRRGGQELPAAKRGRRLRACDACSHAKVSCDAKSQCSRCVARSLPCTYKWLCEDPAHRRQFVKYAQSTLPFLLQVTDPAVDSITSLLINTEPEGDPQGLGILNTSDVPAEPPAFLPGDMFFGYPGDSVGGGGLGGFGGFGGFGGGVSGVGDTSMLGFMPELDIDFDEGMFGLLAAAHNNSNNNNNIPDDPITARMDALVGDVQRMLCLKPKLRETFDRLQCAQFFTTANLLKYLKGFYCRRHYIFPIIHWPTFDPETVCNQLLVAAMLTGASYLRHAESHMYEAIHMSTLCEVAEKYIFRELKSLFSANHSLTPSETTAVADSAFPAHSAAMEHQIQLCQAGLLMVGLRFDVNTDTTINRIATSRLPVLIRALRMMGIVGARHDAQSETDWELFIFRESIIRLVSWSYGMDTMDIVTFNKPPTVTMMELCGQLPCPDPIWDAPSREEFDTRRAGVSLYADFISLRDLMGGLLADEWNEDTEARYGDLTAYRLHYLIFGLQLVIYNVHTSMLPKVSSAVLLRAVDRWDALWEAAIRNTSPEKLRWLGVRRYSRDYSILTRKILEVFMAGKEPLPRYLQRIPSTDMADLHAFIHDYCFVDVFARGEGKP